MIQQMLFHMILAVTLCLTQVMPGNTGAESEDTVVISQGEETEPEQNAEIHRPEDYVDPTFYTKVIIIGDSRTVGLRDSVQVAPGITTIWSCKGAMGYDWMTSTGVPQIEQYIDGDTAIVIWMGVNDLYNLPNYINYVNHKAAEWAESGADTYYAAVGPVSDGSDYVSNQDVADFNMTLQQELINVTYIDLYEHMKTDGFSSFDGVHYSFSTNQDIYNFIINHLEHDNGGVPGSIW